jgi:hypothetical protein
MRHANVDGAGTESDRQRRPAGTHILAGPAETTWRS